MCEKTNKRLVLNNLIDLRENNNKLYDQIFDNIDYFSHFFKQNDNNFDEYSDNKLKQLKSFYRKFSSNQKFIEISIKQFITSFETKIYRNSKQNNDLNSDNLKTELLSPKTKTSSEESVKTSTKCAKLSQTSGEKFRETNIEISSNLSEKYIHSRLNAWPFRCDLDGCKRRFKTKQWLKTHQNSIKHLAKHYICDYADCGQRFISEFNLKIHQKSHSIVKPFSYYKKWSDRQKLVKESIGSDTGFSSKNSLSAKPVETNTVQIKPNSGQPLKKNKNNLSVKPLQKSEVNLKPRLGRPPKRKRSNLFEKYFPKTAVKSNRVRGQPPKSTEDIISNLVEIRPKTNKSFSLITELIKNKTRSQNRSETDFQPINDLSFLSLNLLPIVDLNVNSYQFECIECKTRFISNVELEKHENIVHKIQHSLENPFKCGNSGCDKWFKDRVSVTQHRRICLPKFRCQWPGCEKLLWTHLELKRHTERHNFDSFLDNCIKKEFGSNSGLDFGSSVKTNEKSVKQVMPSNVRKVAKSQPIDPKRKRVLKPNSIIICRKCQKTVVYNELSEHNKQCAVRDTDYKCPKCAKIFRTESELNFHKKLIHYKQNKMSFLCNSCDFQTENEEYLQKHKRIVHQFGYQSIKPAPPSTVSTVPTLLLVNRPMINTTIPTISTTIPTITTNQINSVSISNNNMKTRLILPKAAVPTQPTQPFYFINNFK